MADLKTLSVRLEAQIGGYVAAMRAAAGATTEFGRQADTSLAGVGRDVERLAKTSTATRNALAGAAATAGVAIAAGFGYGIVKAAQLEKSLYNVATISDEVRAHLGETSQALVEMSTRLPQSADELAKGLYDIVSSGFQAKDAMLVLDAAAIGASAGLSTTANSARALTAILNAYGLSASSAADVNDILFQTVNKGVVSYDELAGVVGNFVGSAAAAKVPIDDAASALAAMTLTGLDAAEASTSLNNVLQQIIKPSEGMAAALHKAGYESGSAALQALGLHGTIGLLSKSMGTSTDVALKLFPEIRAARGYLALTSAAGKNYATTFAGIADKTARAQAAQKALAIQSHSAGYQLGILKNQATGVAIGFGQAMLPAIHLVLGGLGDFLDLVHALPGPLQTALGVVALLGGAALLAGGAFLKAKPMLDTFRTSMATLRAEGSVLPGALKGVGVAAGLLGVALVAATAVYGIYAARKAKVKETTDALVASLKAEREGTAGAADQTLVDQIVKSGDIDRLKKAGIGVADYVTAIRGGAEPQKELAARLADAGRSGSLSSKEFIALAGNTIHLEDAFGKASKTAKDSAVATDQVGKAAKKASSPIAFLADLTARDKDGVEQLTEAQKRLASQLASLGDAAGAWSKAMADVTPDALKALAKDSKKQTDSVKSGLKSLAPAARTSLAAFTLELSKGLAEQQAYASNLAALTRRGRADLVAEFVKMGADGPKAAAAAVRGTDSQLARLADVMRSRSSLAGAALSNGLNILAVIAASHGKATVASLAAQFTGGDLAAMRGLLGQIRQSVTDIPTRHTIDILLGKTPQPVVIPIRYSVSGVPSGGLAKLNRLPFAEGGVLRFFAGGGVEDHVAQVAAPGTMRVWAEPETGGEAYIPLAPAKRERSTAVLASVAKDFGRTLVPIGGPAAAPRPQVVEVNRGPLIGSLTVQVEGSNATAAEIADAAFREAHVVARSGGRG